MFKGTTPTITLTFPQELDLSNASVYVTFSKSNGKELFTKGGEDVDVAANVVQVFLTQEETFMFTDISLMQANWTYSDEDGIKRACSNIVRFDAHNNLLRRVLPDEEVEEAEG